VAIHKIRPNRDTLHGHFSPDLAPVVTIESGDTVVFQTLDSAWRSVVDGEYVPFPDRNQGAEDKGHALCGPVAIRGAMPGMVLEIQIGEIRPGPRGRTGGGGGTWKADKLKALGVFGGSRHSLVWDIDSDAMKATNQHNHVVNLRPFLGVIGMPPPDSGVHSTTPPRNWGGNLDCKELVAGSTLYLPVPVDGGLLSVGDGHGAQGDGEVSGVALECPIESAELTLSLREDLSFTAPRANTASGWITIGLHEDLNTAALLALDPMLDLICERFDIHRKDALALASVVVDLRITQIANGVHGVHAVLPHDSVN